VENESRRTFHKKLGTAAALAGGAFLNLNPKAKGANEKVTLALIGGRNQGRGVAKRAIGAGAYLKTLCDIDDAINAKVNPELAKAQERPVEHVKDFRKVLDDKDIDGVIIAAPDHWHTHMALLACQAGKDVFLEKPVSQTIREGQLIRDAARKYKRVMQIGTHRRSTEYARQAMEFLATGKLGKVCLVKAHTYQVRESIGTPPDGTPPSTVDYDVWLGPAPKRPFNPNRFHYNWRFFWDYGNSELGNQGVHSLDMALWGIQTLLGNDRAMPTAVSNTSGIYWLDDAKEVPDTQIVSWQFGKLMLVYELRSFQRGLPGDGGFSGSPAFYGTEGSLVFAKDRAWMVRWKNGDPGPEAKATPSTIEKNFLDCIKSRELPHADIERGRLATTLCHLGNIAHHLRRSVIFDPATETFNGDKEANARLTKTYRKGYDLPKV
jgi:predicted dehydrogenase